MRPLVQKNTEETPFWAQRKDVIRVVKPGKIFELKLDRPSREINLKEVPKLMLFDGSIAFIRENLEKNPSLFQKLSKSIEDILNDKI